MKALRMKALLTSSAIAALWSLGGDFLDTKRLGNGLDVTTRTDPDAEQPWLGLLLGGGIFSEPAGGTGFALLAANTLLQAHGSSAPPINSFMNRAAAGGARWRSLLVAGSDDQRDLSDQLTSLVSRLKGLTLDDSQFSAVRDALVADLHTPQISDHRRALHRSIWVQLARHGAKELKLEQSLAAATRVDVEAWLQRTATLRAPRLVAVTSAKGSELRGVIEEAAGAVKLAPAVADAPLDVAALGASRNLDLRWDLPYSLVYEWYVLECKEAKEHVALMVLASMWNDVHLANFGFAGRATAPEQPEYRADTLLLDPTHRLLLLHGSVPRTGKVDEVRAMLHGTLDQIIDPPKGQSSLADRFERSVQRYSKPPDDNDGFGGFRGGARFGGTSPEARLMQVVELEIDSGFDWKQVFAAAKSLRHTTIKELIVKQLPVERAARVVVRSAP